MATPVIMPVLAVNCSENSKTGPCSATYVTGKSCPKTCPFRKAGCYGETGHVGIVARRLSRSRVNDGETLGSYEAAAIDCLSAHLDLRLHVYGEFMDQTHADHVNAAARRYKDRGSIVGKRLDVWTYTHRWRELSPERFCSVSALASVESGAAAVEAHDAGWAVAVSVPEFPNDDKPFFLRDDGDVPPVKVIPCPAQTRGKQCVDCRLCFDSERLARTRTAIGFRPNHNSSKRQFVRSLETISA